MIKTKKEYILNGLPKYTNNCKRLIISRKYDWLALDLRALYPSVLVEITEVISDLFDYDNKFKFNVITGEIK